MFEQFPYTNFHELNLDWIIQKLKEAYSPDNPPDNMVLSVNGETGDVILYQDAVIRFPDITDATWNIHRLANGSSSGIQFLPGKAQRIDGTDRHDIYDEGNPPPYPVTSVNGETGAVTITIPVQSVNGETGAVVLYRNAITKLPDVTEASWNIYRVCNGTQRGIQFSADKAVRIENTDRYDIYDAGNPPPYPVTSVNGETGAVTIPDVVTDLDAEILNINTATDENYWGFVREVSNGTASIYLDTSNNTIKAFISYISEDDQTNVTLPLLTSADIPSSSGVVSINSKTGAVTLYGTDIYTDSNSQRTVSQELSANANAITAETNRAGNAESTLTRNLNAEIARAGAEEEKLQNAIAIIVDGDSAGQAVPVGGYAYIKNNTHGLNDGLYINSGSSAFPATGGTADSTTFTAVPDGGLNSLNSNVTEISGRMQKVHRFYPTNGARNALDVIPITKSYGSDDSVYIENNRIKFTHAGFILINAVITASSDGNSSGRVWLKLIGSNNVLDAIAYGVYGTGTFSCVQEVNTNSEIYFTAQEKMNVGQGGTTSAIYITWI